MSINTSNTTEALAELRSFLGAIGDNLKIGTVVLIVVGKPLQQCH